MTTAHDTAATLEAAIDAHGANASGARAALDHAITAHVAAEVARRLACAPEVEEAIGNFDDACSSLMRVRCEDTPLDAREPAAWDESLLELYRERKATLLAAIAADKARAVEAATAGAIPKLSRDDAEALVDEFARRFAARSRSSNRTTLVWDREAAARAALLRALGVEA